ncbi:unnamed protein product [[Candida] boidinii]|uniref:Unnamed protein product n=1 Tax=Candida boidinii TaxID=5477 RepID=A0ACB5U6J8_CANBO|nr:unnamed protein product [[Candida] boidinii]
MALNDPYASPSQQQLMLQPSSQQQQQLNHQGIDDQSSHLSSNSLNARSPNIEYDSAISTPSMATQSTNSNHYETSSNNSMKVHSDQLTPTTPNFDHSLSNNSSNSALASGNNNPSSNNLNMTSATSVITSNTGTTLTSTNNTSTIASITSKPWGLFSKRHNTNSNNNNNNNNKNNNNADGNTSNISGTGNNVPYSPTRSVQGHGDISMDTQNASFQTIGNSSNSKSNDILEFKSMAYSDTLPVGSNGTAQLQNHGNTVQLDQLRAQGSSHNDGNTFVRVIEPENRLFGSTLERGLELSPSFTILDKPVPSVVYRSLEYLKKQNAVYMEGIFRLNGMMAEINQIQKAFNEDHDCDYYKLDSLPDCHSIATLLKRYLRTLETPILPDETARNLFSLTISNDAESSQTTKVQ